MSVPASRRVACLTAAGLVAGGCTEVTGPPEKLEELPRQLTVAEQEVIRASNGFAFRLLREVVADPERGSGNVFLSPFSVSMALGMTMNGAAGETYDAMRATLGFDGLEETEINESYRDLTELLLGLDGRTELRIANSIWTSRGHPLYESFHGRVREYFDARVEELDFGSPGALDVINGWVRDATNGRIEEIIKEISPNEIMFLVNGVYFKGRWTSRFDPAETRPGPFRLASDGDPVQVPMMHAERMEVGNFSRRDGPKVGELPYGNQAFSMVVVLPPEDIGVDEFVAALDADTWRAGWRPSPTTMKPRWPSPGGRWSSRPDWTVRS